MAKLKILKFPHQILKTVSSDVEVFNDELRTIVNDMQDTLLSEANGIGLAANQVGVLKKLFIINLDLTKNNDKHYKFTAINPEIRVLDNETIIYEEGCLSIPEVKSNITRSKNIELIAFDENGNKFSIQASNLLAVCIQHEYDHIHGKLFIDYLSPIKRRQALKNYK